MHMGNCLPTVATSGAIVFLLVPPHGQLCSYGCQLSTAHIMRSAQTVLTAQLWMHIECQLTA